MIEIAKLKGVHTEVRLNYEGVCTTFFETVVFDA